MSLRSRALEKRPYYFVDTTRGVLFRFARLLHFKRHLSRGSDEPWLYVDAAG